MSLFSQPEKCSKFTLTKFKKKLKWYLIYKILVVYGKMCKKKVYSQR